VSLSKPGRPKIFAYLFKLAHSGSRNLNYTYPGAKEPALKGVNFKLEAGESLAIVGYNGSGELIFRYLTRHPSTL
jgi:ABC-type transport system involved in cytochrome bd biosynthesis fused ATPase/permease subunit